MPTKLIRLAILLVLVSLITGGCSGPENIQVPTVTVPAADPMDSNSPEASAETTASSQAFRVIPAYEGMAAYVEAARSAPNADLAALFQEHVVDPYWEACAEGGEYIRLAEAATAIPIADLDQLAGAVRALRDANVELLVRDALEEAARLLSGPDTTVCLFAAAPDHTFVRDEMGGVTGMTVGSGKIWIQIFPEGKWTDWVPYTVAHEYHHSVWTNRNPGTTLDLVDYLIFEGRADTFAHSLYPNVIAPWTVALTAEQEVEQWQAMEQNLGTTSLPIQRRFMFGSAEVPRWTGYTIGFQIVQAYLEKHPAATVDEWTELDAHDLLEASDYNPQ